jgi:hypothetical protein
VSLTPTLHSSTFSDPDADDTHAASQWQITTTPGDYSSTVFDSGIDATNLIQTTVPSGTLSYSTTYYWRVRYQDNKGTWSEWLLETSFTVLDARSTHLCIYPDWNLIGIPGHLLDPSIEVVFGGNLQHIKAIYGYDGGIWTYWISGIPSTLNALEAGHGYWLLSDSKYNVTITAYQTDPEPLQQGWNLISITDGTEQSVESYLGGAAWHSIYGYDASTQDWLYNIQGLGGSLTTFKPGEGYWVYVE